MELAAELHDTVKEDIGKVFPKRLQELVSIEIVDLQDHILSTYDRRISEYATEFFRRQQIKLRLGFVVKQVENGKLTLEEKRTGATVEAPFGVCVWCTGIKLNPLCEEVIKALPAGSQDNMRSLTTDSSLRVKGSAGSIFAMGDCATVELKRALPHAEELFATAGKEARTQPPPPPPQPHPSPRSTPPARPSAHACRERAARRRSPWTTCRRC